MTLTIEQRNRLRIEIAAAINELTDDHQLISAWNCVSLLRGDPKYWDEMNTKYFQKALKRAKAAIK